MAMKKLLLYILLLNVTIASAQTKGEVGIGFAFGENDLVRFEQVVGAGNHTGKGLFAFGINYHIPINKRLDFGTGFSIGKYNFRIAGAPGIDFTPVNDEMLIASIPCVVRVNFLKYFFVNAGALMDFSLSQSDYIDSQNGLGVTFGVGAHYLFNSGFGIFINPNLQAHSLIPFAREKFHERMLLSSFQLGFTYKL
jgi:hypothetical protein